MVKKALHIFDSTAATGLDLVPLNGVIFIKSTSEYLVLANKTTPVAINSSTTVAALLASPTQYVSSYSIIAEDNAIDFTAGNNFTITATAANITVSGSTSTCIGKSGTIVIASADNITGWGTEFVWKTLPAGLTGIETFAYFIKATGVIHIGKVV